MNRVEDTFRIPDSCLWFLGSTLILATIPIGFVSGDGLAQSVAFSRGSWSLNPNHLLFEPAGAWWQESLTRLGFAMADPDKLKLLSIMSGAATLGIIRAGLAGPLAQRRHEANHATAWVALGSAFSRLWISDEVHMIQMPFLALAAVAALRFLTTPSLAASTAIGIFISISALFYISNALLFPCLILIICSWYIGRRDLGNAIRTLIGISLPVILILGTVLPLAWIAAAPTNLRFFDWLTSYAGGRAPHRITSGYGTDLSLHGLALASARAAYGAGSTLVDLAPFVQTIRDSETIRPAALLSLLVFLIAASVLALVIFRLILNRHQQTNQIVLLLTLSWTIAVLTFAIYWNNSDDQFYFQLAIPLAALVATWPLKHNPHSIAVVALSSLALLWNASDLTTRFILYPRADRVTILQSIMADSGLLIFPGYDEVGNLLFFIDGWKGQRYISLMSLATRYRPEHGLPILEHRVRDVLASGRRVDVVSVYDVPPLSNPWKDLGNLGYDQLTVKRYLQQFPIDSTSRLVDSFTVRSIRP